MVDNSSSRTRRQFLGTAAVAGALGVTGLSGHARAADLYHNTFTTVCAETGLSNYDRIADQVLSACNYLSNDTTYDFGFLDFGNVPADAHFGKGEGAFVEEAVRNLHNRGDLVDGDHVVVAHNYWEYGYGGGLYHGTMDGNDYHAAAVYTGYLVKDWEEKHFTWHELGHTLGAAHADGCYDEVNCSGGTNCEATNITPMATGYVYGENGNNNVQHSTDKSNFRLDSFRCGHPNPNPDVNHDSSRKEDHTFPFSNRTTNTIEDTVDG